MRQQRPSAAALAIHATLGLIVVVLAITLAVTALRGTDRALKFWLTLAAGLVIGAGFNGASFVDFNKRISSLLMALLALGSIACYALSLVRGCAVTGDLDEQPETLVRRRQGTPASVAALEHDGRFEARRLYAIREECRAGSRHSPATCLSPNPSTGACRLAASGRVDAEVSGQAAALLLPRSWDCLRTLLLYARNELKRQSSIRPARTTEPQ